VIIGVALGVVVGLVFRDGTIAGGLTTADLGELGLLVVRALKMLAVPLVAFAIVDAIPLVFSVDWILARCRSAVNVMSDMLVAILLERWRGARR
jgi:Na+/H+-dicarboxylate symporter